VRYSWGRSQHLMYERIISPEAADRRLTVTPCCMYGRILLRRAPRVRAHHLFPCPRAFLLLLTHCACHLLDEEEAVRHHGQAPCNVCGAAMSAVNLPTANDQRGSAMIQVLRPARFTELIGEDEDIPVCLSVCVDVCWRANWLLAR
jgi:hypothetical protein